MDNADLQFLTTRMFERVVTDLAGMRSELAGMRGELRNAGADLRVLTGIVLGIAREMEHVKDQLGRTDRGEK